MLKIQQFQLIPFFFELPLVCEIIQNQATKLITFIVHIYYLLFIVSSTTPEFLFVKPGDYVAIKKENCENTNEKNKNYWVGQVIDCIGGARNPNSWTLFQVANIDNGEITIINADIVEKILKTSES